MASISDPKQVGLVHQALKRDIFVRVGVAIDNCAQSYATNGLDYNVWQQNLAEFFAHRLAANFDGGLADSIEYANATYPQKVELLEKYIVGFSNMLRNALKNIQPEKGDQNAGR